MHWYCQKKIKKQYKEIYGNCYPEPNGFEKAEQLRQDNPKPNDLEQNNWGKKMKD